MQNFNRFEALEVCQITFQRDSEGEGELQGEGEVRKTLFSSQKREFQQVIKSEPNGIFDRSRRLWVPFVDIYKKNGIADG